MTAIDNPPKHSGPPLSSSELALGQFTETRLLLPRLLSTRQEGVIQELAKRLETTGRIPKATVFTDAVALGYN